MAWAAAIFILSACGDDGTSPPIPELASITVTAPVGSVLAVDASVQLDADPRDAAGAPYAAAVEWSSSAPAVATVTEGGRVTALGPGDAVIEARSGSVAGSLAFSVVDVDEAAIRAFLGDPFVAQLVAAAGTAGGDPGAALAEADAALDAGDVLAARSALDAIADMADSASEPDRRAALAVLALFSARAVAYLGL